MSQKLNKEFLTAEWKYLAIVNYTIDPDVLTPYIPAGTELDTWYGNCYISLVGFRFIKTKIKGFSIPYHKDFEEINLRFYVKRNYNDEIRRGVVFIREIVPKRLVAFVANKLYKENYITLNTNHSIDLSPSSNNRHTTYSWRFKNRWNFISIVPEEEKYLPEQNSKEQFITEHYWGYSSQIGNKTIEYKVEHPKWSIWKAKSLKASINTLELYGTVLAEFLSQKPDSAFLAEGSEITVFQGRVF